MTKVDEHDFYFINRKKTLDQTLYFSQHSMAYQPLEWFEPWYKVKRELRSVDRDWIDREHWDSFEEHVVSRMDDQHDNLTCTSRGHRHESFVFEYHMLYCDERDQSLGWIRRLDDLMNPLDGKGDHVAWLSSENDVKEVCFDDSDHLVWRW